MTRMIKLAMVTVTTWMIIGTNVMAQGVSRETITAEHVEEAIVYILTKGMPKHGIKPSPNHLLMKKPELRRELSMAINRYADTYNVPEMFLVAMAYREGSFKNDAKGKIGEVSTFQVTEHVIKKHKCDVSTYDGATECAAKHLLEKVKKCKNLKGSFMYYATGRTCRADTRKLRWMQWDRWTIAHKLEKMVLKNG
jgi:hypothetical protein